MDFNLNPNELRSSDTQTRLAGAKSELDLGESQSIGLAYMNVFESTLPYIKAPVQLIPNGREGLNTVHAFNRWNPAKELAPAFYFAGDYAHQWNDSIDMSSNAFSGEIGNQFQSLPFAPKLSYTFRSFQGMTLRRLSLRSSIPCSMKGHLCYGLLEAMVPSHLSTRTFNHTNFT